MRIIYAAPANLDEQKAHAIHIVNMCAAIQSNGHDVSLLASKCSAGLAETYGSGESLTVITANEARLPALARGPAFAVCAAITAKKQAASLLYTRHIPTALLSSSLSIPTILELHSPPRNNQNWMVARVFNRKVGLALVLITDALRTEIARRLPMIASEKLFVAPDAAVPQPTNLAIRLSLARPIVGYLGNLYMGKGVELVCDVAARLPDFDFYVVGGDIQQISLLVQRFASIKNLHFVGKVPPRIAYQYINGFDYALLPNQEVVMVNDYATDIGQWTSPLKMFEYMAAGKPIIASRLPVLQEVLKDRENAILADPRDPGAWVAALRHLWANKDVRTRIGERAREDFFENYTWEVRARNVLNFVESRMNVEHV